MHSRSEDHIDNMLICALQSSSPSSTLRLLIRWKKDTSTEIQSNSLSGKRMPIWIRRWCWWIPPKCTVFFWKKTSHRSQLKSENSISIIQRVVWIRFMVEKVKIGRQPLEFGGLLVELDRARGKNLPKKYSFVPTRIRTRLRMLSVSAVYVYAFVCARARAMCVSQWMDLYVQKLQFDWIHDVCSHMCEAVRFNNKIYKFAIEWDDVFVREREWEC